jgi:ferrochelatase
MDVVTKHAMDRNPKTAIFLMAHGAPNCIEDIPRYLDNIRYGLSSMDKVVQEMTDRYVAIGGGSPLLQITSRQSKALGNLFNQNGLHDCKVYFGMRNWSPYIRDIVKEVVKDGFERLLAICLAPQYSQWSTELYFNALREGLKENIAKDLEVLYLTDWSNHPLLIDAFAERYNSAIAKLGAEERENLYTIFTAHSIPAESIKQGDPYVEQYNRTVQAIVDRVKPYQWAQSYQSAGRIPVPWLSPSVETTIEKIAKAGIKTALVFPVGFVSDHIETLYDIDIKLKNFAATHGIDLYRTASLNLSSLFIEALGAIVKEHLVIYSPASREIGDHYLSIPRSTN